MQQRGASTACTTARRSARSSRCEGRRMTANLWEDFARRSRELYEQQAELAKLWLDGQSRLAGTLAEAGTGEGGTGPGQDTAGLGEVWRDRESVVEGKSVDLGGRR